MFPQLSRRLRRCRALFALAFCAWLAMGSATWAKSGCCSPMDMHAATAVHADHHVQHPLGQPEGSNPCTCAHAADRPMLGMTGVDYRVPRQGHWQLLSQDAPQPPFAPPLRPPSA